MTLVPGARLGPYEILASLGAGGMGEVFRARDTRLGRDVAVKVLPDHLATDPKALARFQSEARSVAALSHPNILALHDVGETNGVRYAVTELLEGETLRALVTRGALPLRPALEIARQLADALAAAHGKGIVHRDVKPENVFLTTDGPAKLLDFGLARHAPGLGHADDTRSPTAPLLTETGAVVGTVAYMSPEQARGLPVDHRSDQFSLGVVLYEMLTGSRPFRGTSVADLLASIVRDEPEPVDAKAPALPGPVRWIVERCLAKDAAERYDSTRDLARDLAALRLRAAEAASGFAPAAQRRGGVGSASRHRLAPAAGVAALALLAAATGSWLGGRRTPTLAPASFAFERLTTLPGLESDPALSPDGRTLAFTRSGDLFVQRVGGQNATNLTADFAGYDGEAAFSPDGQRIAFRSDREGGGIFLMGATGESIRRISAWGRSPEWYPDGKRLVAVSGVGTPYAAGQIAGGLRSIDVATGATALLADVFAFNPSVSPRGLRIAYCGIRKGDLRRDIYTVPATSAGEPVPVTEDAAVDWSPFWSPDGKSLYFTSDRGNVLNLWRVAIEESTGRPLGAPEPATLASSSAPLSRPSRDGRSLAFVSDDTVTTIERFAFDPVSEEVGSHPEILHRTASDIANLRISPRGDLLAFNSRGRSDLWVVRADGTGLRQVTDDRERDYFPTFSPDGSRLLFQSDRGGVWGLWTVGVDGSSPATVRSGPEGLLWPSWSPDGKTIACETLPGLALLLPFPFPAGSPLPPPLPPPAERLRFHPYSWSPDGRRLSGVVERAEGGRGGMAVWNVSARAYDFRSDTGGEATFLGDGRRLLFSHDGQLHLADTLSARRKILVPTEAGRTIGFVAVSPDDRTLYTIRFDRQADVWLARLRGSSADER